MSVAAQRSNWHDAYDLQQELWRWMRTDLGRRYMAGSYTIQARGLLPRTQELLLRMFAVEPAKLRSADPIFVSAEMCEVVAHAQETFEPEPLLPNDLMTLFGFMYFETPFEIPDRFDVETRIKAVSWAPIMSEEASRQINVGMFYPAQTLKLAQEHDYTNIDWTNKEPGKYERPVDGLVITLYSEDGHRTEPELTSAPEAIPMHFTPWWFGMTFDGNEVDELGKPTGAGWWWRLVQVSLRLMQQRLSSRTHLKPPRPSRRRAVRLRRERKPRDPDEPEREANYSHRFIVGAHWRNQYYPSERVHRQIWIAAFVKGDESLPLIIRPKRAFTWNR